MEMKLSEMGRGTVQRLDTAASSGEGHAAVELGLDWLRELSSDQRRWRAVLSSGSSTRRRQSAWHQGVLGWCASSARAGRSAPLGCGHGCGALTIEENGGGGGAWTSLH
jgi:hypothetical protein